MDKLLILIPVFNDWTSVETLLLRLDEELARAELDAKVLLIDDGSTELPRAEFGAISGRAIQSVEILHLKRNLGHQRAICIGLCHATEHIPCDKIVVMDADGEDDPRYIPQLLAKSDAEGGKVVFAERTKRSENIVFRVLYFLYCQIHRLLVGHRVRVGNYSVLPIERARSLTVASEAWNHYAAAVFATRIPFTMLPTCRGKRIAGESKMNLVSLVMHGLSAIAVFSDRVGARLLLLVSSLIGLVCCALLAVIGIRLGTDWAIPGWATYTAGLLLVVLVQLICLALVFCILTLANRTGGTFLPIRDYSFFVGAVQNVYPRRAARIFGAMPGSVFSGGEEIFPIYTNLPETFLP